MWVLWYVVCYTHLGLIKEYHEILLVILLCELDWVIWFWSAVLGLGFRVYSCITSIGGMPLRM